MIRSKSRLAYLPHRSRPDHGKSHRKDIPAHGHLTLFCRQYSHNRNIVEWLVPIGKLTKNNAHVDRTLLTAYLEKNTILSLI